VLKNLRGDRHVVIDEGEAPMVTVVPGETIEP
jgi:hypothetical protein